MTIPSDLQVDGWIKLLRSARSGLTAADAALKAAGLPALEWYDVLLELERSGPTRPRDLQHRLLLAQSNLSRQIDRMAAASAVEIRPSPDDGRGHLIAITRQGRALRRRMWPVYAAVIDRQISGDDAALLAQLTATGLP